MTKSLRRVSVLVLALALITLSVLGTTMAKYTSSITATYTNTAKTWNITANSNTEDFDFSTDGDAFYPGMAEMTKTIVVNNAGDVDAVVNATLNVTDVPTNMTVTMTEVKDVTLAAKTGTTTITITINWPFGENADDTADQGSNVNFTVSIVADQKA